MADTADDLINELLTGAMEELDVPRSVEMTMHAVYDDVGRWMGETLGDGDWAIYSQGSGRLGTMVRPPDGGDFDIDSVVARNIAKAEITQQELKDEVGDALDEYVKARASTTGPAPTGCQESRRCWTLSFNQPFHMDVLPAIPDPTAPPTGILLPDPGTGALAVQQSHRILGLVLRRDGGRLPRAADSLREGGERRRGGRPPVGGPHDPPADGPGLQGAPEPLLRC
jgi:hypothetical protein